MIAAGSRHTVAAQGGNPRISGEATAGCIQKTRMAVSLSTHPETEEQGDVRSINIVCIAMSLRLVPLSVHK